MVMRITRGALIFLLVALSTMHAHGATIKVTPDRNPASIHESFQLLFEAEGAVDDDPDFSPLEKYFQILSSGQSSNFSVINGQISSYKRWTLTVMANQPGRIAVPSVSFGSDKSPVVEIVVTSEGYDQSNAQQQDRDVFLEATATPLAPYVQSQVLYKLKLFRAVAISQASMGEPEINKGNAVIERIDEDKTYDTVINGRPYQVVERNYAVYPQTSGEVSIAPVSFMGQVARGSFGFDPFGPPPRTIVRRSEPIMLNAGKIPDSFTGYHWMPAKNLTIAEEWSADPLKLQVGEPITRTLILSATGLMASQLPEMSAWGQAELKYYPDRPILTDDKTDTGITGTRSEKAALIPNQSGEYVLPEISIPWWNIVAGKVEYAVIPQRTIRVEATATGGNTVQSSVPRQQAVERPEDVETLVTVPDITAGTSTDGDVNTTIWKWTSLLMAGLWLVTILVWWQNSSRPGPGPAEKLAKDKSREKVNAVIKEILESCRRNDPVNTKENLLHWARLVWPDSPPLNLGEIGRRTGPGMAQELQRLNDVLYSNGRKDWTADAFIEVFKNVSVDDADNRPRGMVGKLEPLYRI